MSVKFKVGDRVVGHLGQFVGVVLSVEGDLQDVYKVQWDNGPILDELESDLLPEGESFEKKEEVKEEPKAKRGRKVKKVNPVGEAVEKAIENGVNVFDSTKSTNEIEEKSTTAAAEFNLPVALEKGTRVKLTGRIRSAAAKEFDGLLSGVGAGGSAHDFEYRPDDKNYEAVQPVTKKSWSDWRRQAKKFGLKLEVVEVKEPAKRLSPKERVRQKEIAARRLAQLAEARKNLAAKRSLDGTSTKTKETAKEEPAADEAAA